MLIVCPNCATSYQVDAPAIGARGRSVRCVRCRTIWFAAPPAEVPVLQTAETAGDVPEAVSDEAVSAFRAELGTEASAPPDPPSATDEAPAEPEFPQPDGPEPAAGPSLADLMALAAQEQSSGTPAAADADAAAPDEPVALSDIPLADSPPLAPAADDGSPLPPDLPARDNGPEDIESAAVRRRALAQARRRRGRTQVRGPALILVLVAVCAALLAWRKDVVRHMPQLASLYASIGLPVNLRGVTFADLKVAGETHDGVPVLVVEGTIVNIVSTPVEVPRLRFALRNAAGAEVYAWTAVPTQSVLEPGAKLPFRSRLASPPDDGHDVQVRFFTRQDATVGLR